MDEKEGLVVPVSVKAEMARAGIIPAQLMPYWDADTDSTLDPMDEPEIRASIRKLIGQVWNAKESARG